MFAFLTDLVHHGIFSKAKAVFLWSDKTCCDPLYVCTEIINAFQQIKRKPSVDILKANEKIDSTLL